MLKKKLPLDPKVTPAKVVEFNWAMVGKLPEFHLTFISERVNPVKVALVLMMRSVAVVKLKLALPPEILKAPAAVF